MTDEQAIERVVFECTGCGTKSTDPDADLAAIRAGGGLSCCPERKIVVSREAYDAMKARAEAGESQRDEWARCFQDMQADRDHWKARAEKAEGERDEWYGCCKIEEKLRDEWEDRCTVETGLRRETEAERDALAKQVAERDAVLDDFVRQTDAWNSGMEKIIGRAPNYCWETLERARAITTAARAAGIREG